MHSKFQTILDAIKTFINNISNKKYFNKQTLVKNEKEELNNFFENVMEFLSLLIYQKGDLEKLNDKIKTDFKSGGFIKKKLKEKAKTIPNHFKNWLIKLII